MSEVNEEISNQEETVEESIESKEIEPKEELTSIDIDKISNDDIDNLSEDELNNLIDNSDNLVAKTSELETSSKEIEEVKNSEVNDDNSYTPPIDKSLYEQIPENYKALFNPIKANGKEHTYSPEEIIKLTQLGANYYADKEKIKPKLQMVKMMEKAGVDSEEKLIQALDIINGDKEALAKLIKEKEIDLLDVEEKMDEEDFKYTPDAEKYKVEDNPLESIDQQLKDSPVYEKVVSALSSFDESSRNFFIEDPEKILVLDEHMKSGLYEASVNEIERRKQFGDFRNTSFIQAYEEVAQGILNSNSQEEPPKKETVTKKVHEASSSIPSSMQSKTEGNAPTQGTINLNDEKFINSLSENELDKLLNQIQ